MTTTGKIDQMPIRVSQSGISASLQVQQMYTEAMAAGLIAYNDVLTCRDILEMTGCQDAEPAVHATMIALFAVTAEGSLCLPIDLAVLTREFSRFCKYSGPDSDLSGASSLAASAIALVAGRNDVLCNPRGLSPYPFSCVDGKRLYFQKHYRHESSLEASLKVLRDAPADPLPGCDDGGARLRHIIATVSAGRDGRNLNEEQRLAVMLAMSRRFLVISGGPGTGKTRILASLLRALSMAGVNPDQILLAAPTGRAGKRMGESINAALDDAIPGDGESGSIPAIRQMSGSTIHRALGYNPGRNEYLYGPHNPLPYRFFVCDEVSMVDVALMDRFLRAMPLDARVVFLGDRDQLPSVDAGAVLGDIIPRKDPAGNVGGFVPEFSPEIIQMAGAVGISSEVFHSIGPLAGRNGPSGAGPGPMCDSVVMLTRTYRSRGQVSSIAGAVSRVDVHAFDSAGDGPIDLSSEPVAWGEPGATCKILQPSQTARDYHERLVVSWLGWLYGVSDAARPGPVDQGRRVMADAFRNFSRVVVDLDPPGPSEAAGLLLERLFESMERGRILCALRDGPEGAGGINRRIAGLVGAPGTFFPGCPIMITRNMPGLDLYNGDIGVVMKGRDGLVAVFRDGGRYRVFPLGSLGRCEMAFAMTIHKSQGSEYGNVMIFLSDNPDHPLLAREILYTAMTRSKNNVWFVARRECLAAAISRGASRYTGLDLWSR